MQTLHILAIELLRQKVKRTTETLPLKDEYQ
jgi:hypothetical protein